MESKLSDELALLDALSKAAALRDVEIVPKCWEDALPSVDPSLALSLLVEQAKIRRGKRS